MIHAPHEARHPDAIGLDTAVQLAAVLVLLEEGVNSITLADNELLVCVQVLVPLRRRVAGLPYIRPHGSRRAGGSA
jgi:hypothetical protein